ncbi:MAG: hypothetical protein LBO66_07850 [Deltaproteobacteria bacterium]|jgi:hypothetical protein|nr:hypothetical protein [Deltaproteobacteria bacterium]
MRLDLAREFTQASADAYAACVKYVPLQKDEGPISAKDSAIVESALEKAQDMWESLKGSEVVAQNSLAFSEALLNLTRAYMLDGRWAQADRLLHSFPRHPREADLDFEIAETETLLSSLRLDEEERKYERNFSSFSFPEAWCLSLAALRLDLALMHIKRYLDIGELAEALEIYLALLPTRDNPPLFDRRRRGEREKPWIMSVDYAKKIAEAADGIFQFCEKNRDLAGMEKIFQSLEKLDARAFPLGERLKKAQALWSLSQSLKRLDLARRYQDLVVTLQGAREESGSKLS